jgi:hypothetical protein
MRYSDGPWAEVEELVAAPIDRVWSLVCDIDLPARFSSEFEGATWLDPGPALGARFAGRNRHPAIGSWETTCWVTRYDPPLAFAWAVADPEHPAATWWYTLEELEGVVRLRQGGRMGPAPSGLTAAITARPELEERIVARRLEEWERNLRATVTGIKALAEGNG